LGEERKEGKEPAEDPIEKKKKVQWVDKGRDGNPASDPNGIKGTESLRLKRKNEKKIQRKKGILEGGHSRKRKSMIRLASTIVGRPRSREELGQNLEFPKNGSRKVKIRGRVIIQKALVK